jgi:hypothetical protein
MEKNQGIINQGLSGMPAEVSVRAFGAVGDGFADDTSALQRALDSGARRVIIPPGCFLIRRTLEPAAGQCVVIDGTIKIADAERSPLARDVRSGDRSVLVEDASGFQVGDTISIHDDKHVSICGCRLDLELSPQAERVETGKLIKLRGE